MDLKAKPNGSIDICGTTFTSVQVSRIDGNVGFNNFAPYAGLGFQSGFFGDRVNFAFDVGVLFQATRMSIWMPRACSPTIPRFARA